MGALRVVTRNDEIRVDGNHPPKRSGGGDNWPPVFLSEGNVTPLEWSGSNQRCGYHYRWCQGSGIVPVSAAKSRVLIPRVMVR